MTDKSKREIERRLEQLDRKSVSFREYCEFHRRCINAEGRAPTEKEFFGRELTPSERTSFWHQIRAVWNGEEEPPSRSSATGEV